MVDATLAYLRQGGWVMLPLVTVSLVMWALILERWQVLRGLSRDDLDEDPVAQFERLRPAQDRVRPAVIAIEPRDRLAPTGRQRDRQGAYHERMACSSARSGAELVE